MLSTPSPTRARVWFLTTFVAAWLALDRLITSPPTLASATLALAAAGTVLVLSETLAQRRPASALARRLGLGRPEPRALVAAVIVGVAIVATYLGGSAAFGIELELRSNWPTVLVAAFLFHGVAEELVWRGYAFGHLRRAASLGRAITLSVPLIALTHVPIMVTTGVAIGLFAVVCAAATSVTLAYLYERGGRTIWAPAIVHGSVGTWQLFERSYGVGFNVLILTASTVVPFLAFAFGDRFFNRSEPITAPVPVV